MVDPLLVQAGVSGARVVMLWWGEGLQQQVQPFWAGIPAEVSMAYGTVPEWLLALRNHLVTLAAGQMSALEACCRTACFQEPMQTHVTMSFPYRPLPKSALRRALMDAETWPVVTRKTFSNVFGFASEYVAIFV